MSLFLQYSINLQTYSSHRTWLLYRDRMFTDYIVEGAGPLVNNPPIGDVQHKVFNKGIIK